MSSGDKAFFAKVDNPPTDGSAFADPGAGNTFYVQFNPKEFKLDDGAQWESSDEHGKEKPLITY